VETTLEALAGDGGEQREELSTEAPTEDGGGAVTHKEKGVSINRQARGERGCCLHREGCPDVNAVVRRPYSGRRTRRGEGANGPAVPRDHASRVSIQLLKRKCTIITKHNCMILKDGVNDPGLAFAGKIDLGPF
jgi:hypothetical protein